MGAGVRGGDTVFFSQGSPLGPAQDNGRSGFDLQMDLPSSFEGCIVSTVDTLYKWFGS